MTLTHNHVSATCSAKLQQASYLSQIELRAESESIFILFFLLCAPRIFIYLFNFLWLIMLLRLLLVLGQLNSYISISVLPHVSLYVNEKYPFLIKLHLNTKRQKLRQLQVKVLLFDTVSISLT